VEYAAAVGRRLGDRVKHWTTHNEPWCIATLGHETGAQAPGHEDPAEALRVAHHLLLSHGWAVKALRTIAPAAELGIVLNLVPAWAATPSEADRDAQRRFDGLFNRWYLDPLYRGEYPADAVHDRVRRGHLAGPVLPFVKDGDMQAIAETIDFLGVNYYSRVVVKAGADGEPEAVPAVPKEELTDMGWEVFPGGLYDLLLRLKSEYAPQKIYITENGAAYSDGAAGGRIIDRRRIDYLHGHLLSAHRALSEGVPLRGYFAWSLLDNFEWSHGYEMRFGLFHVDYKTQRRSPKESANWYRSIIAANAVAEPAQ
jgi:beta-glucosidase